ncbi:MAG: MBL fold metallo-hydrolase [Endomicrobiaceae bacterium]|nr:MBL fold metallo-hydrolase [Endomicrobiaceae bacterium]
MQITKNIHALKIPFKVKISPTITADRFVYVYIITGKKIWLIDSGVAGSKKNIFDYIESIKKNPKDIESIFLTHSHPDHIGAAKSIKEYCNCKIYIHPSEKNWVEDVNLQYSQRPVPGFNELVEGSVKVDNVVNDGDIIKLDGNLSLKVFHTPGHSNGSVSYLLEKDGALFCGDAILSSGQMPIFDDLARCIDSVKKLSDISNVDILLSAWDIPYEANHIQKIMSDSINFSKKIDETIRKFTEKENQSAPMEFCKQIISELNLPVQMANPLTSRSFQSVLKQNDKS